MKKIIISIIFLFIFNHIGFARIVHVRSSVTKSGKYRQSHNRTSPNKIKIDNWSTRGNVNPYTGKKGARNL